MDTKTCHTCKHYRDVMQDDSGDVHGVCSLGVAECQCSAPVRFKVEDYIIERLSVRRSFGCNKHVEKPTETGE